LTKIAILTKSMIVRVELTLHTRWRQKKSTKISQAKRSNFIHKFALLYNSCANLENTKVSLLNISTLNSRVVTIKRTQTKIAE
jgi:hypothetical protein